MSTCQGGISLKHNCDPAMPSALSHGNPWKAHKQSDGSLDLNTLVNLPSAAFVLNLYYQAGQSGSGGSTMTISMTGK